MKKVKDFAAVIRDQLAHDPELAAAVEEEFFNAEIAIQVYNARAEAGLTQRELAKRIDSHQSVIARLENANYKGHSLSMLKRIAKALNKRLSIEFQKDILTPREDLPVVNICFGNLEWRSEEWEATPEICFEMLTTR